MLVSLKVCAWIIQAVTPYIRLRPFTVPCAESPCRMLIQSQHIGNRLWWRDTCWRRHIGRLTISGELWLYITLELIRRSSSPISESKNNQILWDKLIEEAIRLGSMRKNVIFYPFCDNLYRYSASEKLSLRLKLGYVTSEDIRLRSWKLSIRQISASHLRSVSTNEFRMSLCPYSFLHNFKEGSPHGGTSIQSKKCHFLSSIIMSNFGP